MHWVHQRLADEAVPPITRIFTAVAVERGAIQAPGRMESTVPVRPPRRPPEQVFPHRACSNGHCVRLHQGDYGPGQPASNDDPVARRCSGREGAERLHLVESSMAPERACRPNDANQIGAITTPWPSRCKLGGGGGAGASGPEALLSCGLDGHPRHVAIGGAASWCGPHLAASTAAGSLWESTPEIGKVATRAGLEESTIEATALAASLEGSGVAADQSARHRHRMALLPQTVEALRQMAAASSNPVTPPVGGSLHRLLSLLALNHLGVQRA